MGSFPRPLLFICAVNREGTSVDSPVAGSPLAAAAHELFKACMWSQDCEPRSVGLWFVPLLQVLSFQSLPPASCPSPALSAAVLRGEH